MASGGNTWFKKLEHKRKLFEMKRAKGNEKGVMSHAQRTKNPQARSLDLLDIKDKPGVTSPGKPADKAPLPMAVGWKPQPYMTAKMRKLMAKERPVGKILRASMKQW
jgi:hypothetical protein